MRGAPGEGARCSPAVRAYAHVRFARRIDLRSAAFRFVTTFRSRRLAAGRVARRSCFCALASRRLARVLTERAVMQARLTSGFEGFAGGVGELGPTGEAGEGAGGGTDGPDAATLNE